MPTHMSGLIIRLSTITSMAAILLHPQIGRLIAQHLDAASLVLICDASIGCRNLYVSFLGPLARVRMQQLYTSSRQVLQAVVRRALVRSGMSENSSYGYLHFRTGVICDTTSVPGHFLCAALAVLAEKAKRIPQHLVMGCVTPLDVDLGPYDTPTDRETIYDHALKGYGLIGRKAGDMTIAGKTFSISEEYSKICPSLLIRPIMMQVDIGGSVMITTDSCPEASHNQENKKVKQQWPPFTLWSKSDLEELCHSEAMFDGLSYYDWGIFLTMLTGDFPPGPPFDPQAWGNPDEYETGTGESHSRFTAYQTHTKKKTYCEHVHCSVWCPL